MQETKAQPDQVPEALKPLSEYQVYANSAEKKGYSGTAVLKQYRHSRDLPDYSGVAANDDAHHLNVKRYEAP